MASTPVSYTGNPPAIPGRPVVQKFPTPNLDDRIYVVRMDSRVGGYEEPDRGAPYRGPNAEQFKGFVFSTAAASDQLGWVDWFFLNERLNQEEYNYTIDYPYTDHDYPRYTRTYVLLRTDVVEPTSDDVDPVFDGTDDNGDEQPDELLLVLTDHKQTRFEDPILDGLFVGVTRVYERLPGPVITSYLQNEKKQIVTVETQAVEKDDLPVSSALTESIKIERENTAKAIIVKGTVPDVFPGDNKTTNWGSAFRDPLPLEFRKAIPLRTALQIVAGSVVDQPVLQDILIAGVRTVDLTAHETKVTEFTKEKSLTQYDLVHTEVDSEQVNAEGQIETVQKILDPEMQTSEVGPLVVGGGVDALGDGSSIKTVRKVPVLFPRLEVETSVPDLLPPEFRADVPTYKEAVNATGPVENPPTLGPGVFEHKETQTTEYNKRIEISKHDYGSFPKEFIDKKLTEEYGGGILDIVRVVDQAVLAPEEGFDIVSSFVKHLGGGLMIRETERVEGGDWPELTGFRTEERGIFAGIKTKFWKKVVPAGTPDPVPHPFDYNFFSEITPHDKWRSIQILTACDLDNLPAPYDVPDSAHISLPPTLDALIGLWSNHGSVTSVGGFDDDGKASVTVVTGLVGSVGIIHHGGHNGVVQGRLHRSFHRPGVFFSVAPVKKIVTSAGYITMQYGFESDSGVKSSKEIGQAGGVNLSSIGGGITREVIHVDGFLVKNAPVLSGGFDVQNQVGNAVPESGSAHSGVHVVSIGVPTPVFGPVCRFDYNLPNSIPASLTPGEEILWDVRIIDWNFGVKVMEEIYYRVPV
jgi:hypothetical protein